MADTTNPGRRRFLRRTAVTLAALPVAGIVFQPHRQARADRPRAEDGHAHDYVNHAADASDHPEFQEGNICENCAFWSGEVENGWGGCHHPDFADVLVNANGWCDAYAPGG